MSIQGALAASLRRFDPYPAFDLVFDPKGQIVPGRPIYKLGGRYFDRPEDMPGWSYTRAGADLIVHDPASGRLLGRFPADVPPIVPGYGLESAHDTTNKCVNFNLNPTDLTGVSNGGEGAVLSVVPRAALPAAVRNALEAYDPAGHITAVYKAVMPNNGSPNNVIISGGVGNTSAHSLSVTIYVESVSGAITFGFSANDGQAEIASAPSATWTRVRRENIVPGTAGRTAAFRTGSGASGTFYFILNQLEEKPYATPPVPVAGAQASRGAPALQIAALDPVFARPFTLVAKGKGRAADSVTRVLMQLDNGSNSSAERVQLCRNSTNGVALVNGGGTNISTSGGLYVGALDVRAAGQVRLDGVDLAHAGQSLSPIDTATLADRNRLTVGSSGAGTATWGGAIEFAGIIGRATSQAERELLAA